MNKCIQEFPFSVYEGGEISPRSIVPVTDLVKKHFIESLIPSQLPKGEDFEILVRKDGVDFKCKFSDIVEAFKLVSETDNQDKYVRTEEKLGVRSYVVEYHGYSAEDVKLLINGEF